MNGEGAPNLVVLVRHGETAFNADGRFRGRADPSLTPRGLEQAVAVARGLTPQAGGILVSSPRTRARETADAIAQELGAAVAIDDRLDDIDYGDWTGLTRADVLARWPAEFALWLEAPNRLRIPGGERVAAARDRVWEAVCQLSSKRSAVVVVTHDACIRLAIVALLDAPLVSMHALRTDLTSITEFAFGAEGPQLTRVNDTSHLAGQPDDRPAR